MRHLMEKLFHLQKRNTTVATEARGAVTTFLTMAYILVVNPSILQAAGVPFHSAVVCTAAAAGLCSILMGLVANFPLALASGMGLNAIIAYQIAGVAESWQVAMGLVFWNGIIILILVLAGLREAVMHAIPRDLRLAIGAGIGLFIAFIGAVNARMVIVPMGTVAVLKDNPSAVLPPVTFGSLSHPDTALAVIGLFITAILVARKVKGALVLGIIVSVLIGFLPFFGVTQLPEKDVLLQAPDFSILGQADLKGALSLKLLPLLFAFLMVDFFDTLGTVTAVSRQAGLQDEKGNVPRLQAILAVDSISASIGGLFGVSSVTSYVESAAGISEGARTGLHTVFVGILFVLAIFLAPLAAMTPSAATAPALILVGFLMCGQMAQIDFKKFDTAIPAFITLITLPITYSISHGIGLGFLSFVAIKYGSGKFREVKPLMLVVSLAFAAYFIWG